MPNPPQWRRVTDLHQQGRLEEAETLYREILGTDPDHVVATHMLGMLLHQLGRSDEALVSLERAIELGGTRPAQLANTAKVYTDLDHSGKALKLLEQALSQDGQHFGAWYNQAQALRKLGRPAEALASAEQAVAVQPENPDAHLLMAAILAELGRYGEQRQALERALGCGADPVECRIGIAATLAEQKKIDAAHELLARFGPVEIAETDLVYRVVLIFQKLGAWVDVREWSDAVVAREPSHVEALLRRGLASALLGDPRAALEDYRRILTLDPSYHQVHSNLLSRLQYDDRVSPGDILAAHVGWASQHVQVSREAARCFGNDPDPERTLNIGWLSPRFDSSLVERFLPTTIKAMPGDAFRHFFYNTRKEVCDIPAPLPELGSWRTVDGLDDEELARLIAEDKVDILVDLAGHNPGNRLIAVGSRLAPVQVSWLDYFSTTGVPAMDYWISDAYLTPAGHGKYFSESLVRLPHTRLCYSPPDVEIEPARSDRPAEEIVFGSFNRLGKLVDVVIETWTEILQAVAGSRLLLKAFEFNDRRVRAFTRSRFEKAGLEVDRLELRPASGYGAMLAEYGDMDIALDPFPFTGCATSCDALWMGVPLVSLYGETVVSRQGLSILENIGRREWIASNRAGYRDIAVNLAANIAAGEFDRPALRRVVEASYLCDSAAQGDALSGQFRAMWRTFTNRPDSSSNGQA